MKYYLLLVISLLANLTVFAQTTLTMANTTVNTCSATFYDSGGANSNYSTYENYTMTICPNTPNSVIRIAFTTFDLENSFDNLYINSGNGEVNYTGTNSPGIITSTNSNGCITLRFISDGSVQYTGWVANITCIVTADPPAINIHNGTITTCSNTLYDTGGATGNYGANEKITLTICPSSPNSNIQLNFAEFNLEAVNDYLRVYQNNAPIGTSTVYSGTTTPPVIVSTHASGCITLQFTSNASVQNSGFKIFISCTPNTSNTSGDIIMNTNSATFNTCGANFYDSGGLSGNYTNNENRTYTFCPVSPEAVMNISFSSFATESSFDYMRIYNGSTATGTYLQYSGTSLPPPFTSTAPGGCITIQFLSDGSVLYGGWAAQLICLVPPEQPATPATVVNMTNTAQTTLTTCNALVYDSGGATANYGNSETRTYTFCPETPNQVISVTPVSVDLETCCDYLNLYHGTAVIGTAVNLLNSVGLTIYSTAANGCVTIRFTSDGSVNRTGYELRVQCSEPPTTPVTSTTLNMPTTVSTTPVSGCGVRFYDSGGANDPYPNSATQQITFCPDNPNDVVRITFLSFNIENSWDYLYIYSGSSNTGTAFSYTGSTLPPPFISTNANGCITIRFTSDGSVSYAGWEALVDCVPRNNGYTIWTPPVTPAPSPTCPITTPYCGDNGWSIANTPNANPILGPNYGCIQPPNNPTWYYMQADQAGAVQLTLSQTSAPNGGTPMDVDFALWGPFNNVNTACTSILNGQVAPIQCSYGVAATETIALGSTGGSGSGQSSPPSVQAGQYYIIVISNYTQQSGYITLEQTGGNGSMDCSIVPLALSSTIMDARAQQGYNQISWTAENTNWVSTYLLDHSIDGIEWERIATKTAENASSQSYYDFNHYYFPAVVNYYRLIEKMTNGTENIVDIKPVDNRVGHKEIIKVTNTLGQDIPWDSKGLVIYIYTDGTSSKVYR